MKPLAIDLYCGLGGWAEGFLAEGYDVIGFDIERHEYGEHKYPGQLVIQDVLDLHGSQFRNARVIVASPPCQEPSYRAMPWSRAKALNCKPPSTFLCLFYACFKIAREAGVPVIVENVRGAQTWVGQAAWNFGSYFLWGDIPALMPITMRAIKVPGFGFDGSGKSFQSASVAEKGIPHRPTGHWTNPAENGTQQGGDWFNIAHNTTSGTGNNPDGRKVGGDWFGTYAEQKAAGTISPGRLHGKGSEKRKAASAMIAKIPFPLARHIARSFA